MFRRNFFKAFLAIFGIMFATREAKAASWTDVVGGSNGGLVPTGSVFYFATQTAPEGYLVCDGSAISRSSFPSLFALIGSMYGAGDGSTTFNLPDLRGEFIRGYDNGRGVDPGRGFGSWQKGTLVAGYDDNYANIDGCILQGGAYNYGGDTPTVSMINKFYSATAGGISWFDSGGGGGSYLAKQTYPTDVAYCWANITRPRNVALLVCIKT